MYRSVGRRTETHAGRVYRCSVRKSKEQTDRQTDTIPTSVHTGLFGSGKKYLNFYWIEPKSCLCLFSCSWLLEAIDCIGCKPWQSVFPTRAMNLERYYYNYGLADYLTPMRLYDLCRADEEGNRNCTIHNRQNFSETQCTYDYMCKLMCIYIMLH